MEELACLLPPSVQDRLPERHLASFWVECVSILDPHEPKAPHTSVGSGQFNPQIGKGILSMVLTGDLTYLKNPSKTQVPA